jgi:hypothetical protein
MDPTRPAGLASARWHWLARLPRRSQRHHHHVAAKPRRQGDWIVLQADLRQSRRDVRDPKRLLPQLGLPRRRLRQPGGRLSQRATQEGGSQALTQRGCLLLPLSQKDRF